MTDAYIAEHLWLATTAIYGLRGYKLETPRYTELVEPSLKKEDNRTAQQIIDDICAKL